jgi:hypothetical protein
MRNVETLITGTTLVIRIQLDAAGEPSASGKSEVLASTLGNIDVPGAPGVKLGVNCFKLSPKPAKK